MILPLKRNDQGADIAELQKILGQRGYPVEEDGVFGTKTYRAVRAFQCQNLDPRGGPLVVDGQVGPLTWWSLTNPKPVILTAVAVDFSIMPPVEFGGSMIGRQALQKAIDELKAGAREIGGNNRGPYVKKYLEPAGLPEGESWCASFVSWCFCQASNDLTVNMPFSYCPGARKLLQIFKEKGWGHPPNSGYIPLPGDIVVWWREQLSGWKGHVGLVYQYKDGLLYTIEGNKSPKVQGFSYVFSRIEQLLGFGHVL